MVPYPPSVPAPANPEWLDPERPRRASPGPWRFARAGSPAWQTRFHLQPPGMTQRDRPVHLSHRSMRLRPDRVSRCCRPRNGHTRRSGWPRTEWPNRPPRHNRSPLAAARTRNSGQFAIGVFRVRLFQVLGLGFEFEFAALWGQEENVIGLKVRSERRRLIVLAVLVVVPMGRVVLRFGLPQQRGSRDLAQIPLQFRVDVVEVRLIRVELFNHAIRPTLLNSGGYIFRNPVRVHHLILPSCCRHRRHAEPPRRSAR